MTIQELYIFACKDNLLNNDIYDIINKFKASSQTTIINRKEESHYEYKVHYSYEDVLELFGN